MEGFTSSDLPSVQFDTRSGSSFIQPVSSTYFPPSASFSPHLQSSQLVVESFVSTSPSLPQAVLPAPVSSHLSPSSFEAHDIERDNLDANLSEQYFGGLDRRWEDDVGSKPHACKSFLVYIYIYQYPGKHARVLGSVQAANADILLLPPAVLMGRLDLKFVHTDPAHQRRGAGALMMAWGVKEADKRGLTSYVQASPQGQGLYAKFGFELVDIYAIDLSKWGGPEREETAIMIRPARAAAGS